MLMHFQKISNSVLCQSSNILGASTHCTKCRIADLDSVETKRQMVNPLRIKPPLCLRAKHSTKITFFIREILTNKTPFLFAIFCSPMINFPTWKSCNNEFKLNQSSLVQWLPFPVGFIVLCIYVCLIV